jgi:hypothetical protein
MLFAGQVNLTNRADALGNRSLELGRVPVVNTLSKIGHLHGNHEERDQDYGTHAENNGIHVKKLLVATHGTTPNVKLYVDQGTALAGGERLYYKVSANAVAV